MNVSERYQRGEQALRAIGPFGDQLIDSLKDIAPELADYIIEFGFGGLLSRTELDLRTRELATIASLAALGYAPGQLKVHVHGALNAGATKQEVVEVLMQSSLYAGIPAAVNGLAIAKQVFGEHHNS